MDKLFKTGGVKFWLPFSKSSLSCLTSLRLSLFAFLLMFSCTMFAESVTFDATADKPASGGEKAGKQTLTKDGITITISSGMMNGTQYRCYKNQTMTIKSTVGNITNIELTCTASETTEYGPGNFTTETGTYTYKNKVGTWTGDVADIVFTASKQVRMTKVVVTYDSGKKDANLAFSETEINIESGVDEFTAPTFTKETTAAVTFTSDNEEVATVNANGVISLAGGLGTAVITATSEANDDYEAGTATCTIYVAKYNVYRKVSQITSGKDYLIVAQRDNSTMYAYPLSKSYTHGYLSVGTVNELTDEIKVNSNYDDGFTFTSVDGGYTIQDCYDRYLYHTGNYNSFNVSTDETNAAVWTVEPQGDGTFKIATDGYFMQWGDGTYTTWGVYTTKQDDTVLPMLYEKVETATGQFTISDLNYATFYTEDAYIMPEGVKGGIITEANKTDKTLTVDYRYESGSIVPAKTALLLNGENKTYQYEITTSGEEAPEGNMLHGADDVDSEGNTHVDGTNVRYYILSYSDANKTSYGFYWAAAKGGPITYQKPYAFLAIDFDSAHEAAIGFSLDGNGGTSGISSINASSAKAQGIYTMTGMYAGKDTKKLVKGVYIVNGRKMVIK